MTEELEEFRARFHSVAADAFRFCSAARAQEYQIQSIDRLCSLAAEARSIKLRIIEEGAEQPANEMLCYQELTGAVIEELRMWVLLKNDDPDNAWDAAVAAETHYRLALQAHNVAEALDAIGNMRRLQLLQRVLFPAQIFVSAGSMGGRSICTICDSEYGSCDHLAGIPYMGKLCLIGIEDAHLREVSVVDVPALKTARVHSCTQDGVTRNIMTWRPVHETSNAPGDLLDQDDQD